MYIYNFEALNKLKQRKKILNTRYIQKIICIINTNGKNILFCNIIEKSKNMEKKIKEMVDNGARTHILIFTI